MLIGDVAEEDEGKNAVIADEDADADEDAKRRSVTPPGRFVNTEEAAAAVEREDELKQALEFEAVGHVLLLLLPAVPLLDRTICWMEAAEPAPVATAEALPVDVLAATNRSISYTHSHSLPALLPSGLSVSCTARVDVCICCRLLYRTVP